MLFITDQSLSLCYVMLFFFSYSCSLFFLCLYKFVSHFPLCVAITTNPNIHLYTYIDIYVVSRFRFRDMIKDLIAVFYFAIGNELNEFFVLSNVFFFFFLLFILRRYIGIVETRRMIYHYLKLTVRLY